jgi:hypothetical protein
MKLMAAALAALCLPASTAAALEVKLATAPKTPARDSVTTIQLRPYWTYKRADGSCCVLKPAAVKYPFRIEIVSPKGVVSRMSVRRTKDRFVWIRRIVFAAPGRWTVRAPQWGPRYSRHYGARPRITVTVR